MKTIKIIPLALAINPTAGWAQGVAVFNDRMSQNIVSRPNYFHGLIGICWTVGPALFVMAVLRLQRITTSKKADPSYGDKKRKAVICVLASLLVIASPVICMGLGFR